MEKTTFTELQLLQLENSKLVSQNRLLKNELQKFKSQQINMQLKSIEQEKQEHFVELLKNDLRRSRERVNILERQNKKFRDLLEPALDFFTFIIFETNKLDDYKDMVIEYINMVKDTLRKD